MTVRGKSLSLSLLGVKRTWLVAAHMSASDPKRTSGFVAFSPFQSARLTLYDLLSEAFGGRQ
jgi:hypothetical protein